jgi:hypothetical protein
VFGLDDAAPTMGEEQPFAGWFSRTYGQWEPAPWLQTARAPKVWGVGRAQAHSGDEAVTIDGLTLRVSWTGHGARLDVTDASTGETHEMRAE